MSLCHGLIGTYTSGASQGIYAFTLDEDRGKLLNLHLAAEAGNPTYLAIGAGKQHVYSVMKKGDRGGVAAFRIGPERVLIQTGEVLSAGAPPCYLSVDDSGRRLVSANYHKGTITAYALDTNGGLMQPPTDEVQRGGRGADPDRQEGPHVHYADFTPDHRLIAAIDLGTDQLITYQVAGAKLIERNSYAFPPGTGPRHLLFHPVAPFAYVLSELSSEIIALNWDAAAGRFTHLQTISALPAGFSGHNQGGAVKIAPDGRFLYVSNRGHNSLGVYSIDAVTGELGRVGHFSSGGAWPRDFSLDPAGNWLITANQQSDTIVLFRRDSKTGELIAANSELVVPNPVCIKFF